MTLLEKRARKFQKGLRTCVSRLDEELSARNVHHLRTTIRRFETLVAFVKPRLTGKQRETLQDLDSLRKRAGKVRDLDIQMGLLSAIANGSARADRRDLLQALSHKRQRQARRLKSALSVVNKQKFFARVERLGENAASVPSSFQVRPLESAVSGLRQLAGQLAGSKTIKPRKLHQARVALKKLRYLAELAEESPELLQFVSELKPVQSAIGEWHDWESLARAADRHFSDRINCPLLVEINALFGARYSAANAAVGNLLAEHRLAEVTAPQRKQPAPAPTSSSLARTA